MLTPTPTPVAEPRDLKSVAQTRPPVFPEPPSSPKVPFEPGWIDLAELATEASESDHSPETATALLYIAARLRTDVLNEPDVAFDCLEAARAQGGAATLPLVLRAERALCMEAGTVLVALRVLDFELAVTAAHDRRADLLIEKAGLLADGLMLIEPAHAAVEEALRLVPGHASALVFERILAERHGTPEWLFGNWERTLAAAASAPERARALTRLALLAEREPKQLPAALGYFLRALDEDGRGDAAAVARAGLRRVSVRLGRDAECLRALMAEADALTPGPVRAAWLTTAAAVSRHRLGTTERATTTVELALNDEPSDLMLLSIATEEHLAAGRWRRVIELLDRQSELLGDPEYVTVLQAHAAYVAEQQLGDDEGAGTRLRRVLAVRPSDPVALQAMERIASRTGDVSLQIELMSGAVGRAEDSGERAALAVRVAELNELGLSDLDAAAAFARRALDAIPGYGPAVHTLEGLYARLDRWGDMLGVIEIGVVIESAETDTAVGSPEDLAARHLERQGGVYETGLNDPGKAIEIYRRWVDTGIRKASALTSLLRAAEKAGDSLVAGEAAMRIGIELSELEPAQRIAWRYRAATLYEERAAADAEAIAAFKSVLELAPRFRPAFAGLARAYRRMGNWADLADVLSSRASCEATASRGASLELEAARLHADRLLAPDDALESLTRALAFEPGNLGALDFRWRLLERLGRIEEATHAVGELCERISDPNARAALWRRQAELLEWHLRRPREALVSVERALAAGRFPGVLGVELAQERLFDLVGRSGEAAALQWARLGPPSVGASDAATGAMGRRLDLALRLPDPKEALRAVEQICEVASANVFVLEIAVLLAHGVGDHAAAAAAWERMGNAVAADSPFRVSAWRAAIGAYQRLGRDASDCYGLYKNIAEGDPQSDATATFERLAVQAGRWSDVLWARQMLLASATEPTARALRLWETACARLQTDERNAALSELERAREASPSLAPVGFLLARLREFSGLGRAAAEAYVEFAKASRSPKRAVGAFRVAGRLFADVVRDDAAASRAWEELLVLEPDADEDFTALEVILRQRGDFDRLVSVARRRAEHGDLEVRRNRLFQLSQLLRERHPVDAVEPLTNAVALDPKYVPSLLSLGELFAELGRASEAVTAFRRAVTVATDSETVAAAWTRVGQIAAGNLGDLTAAVAAYRSALSAAPRDVAVLTGLTQALMRQRQYVSAAQTLRQLASVDPDPSARVGHWISLGEILSGPARDPEGAADALEKALELSPERSVVIDRLDVVLTDLKAPERLAAALTRHLEAVPDALPRRLRLARLLRNPIGDLTRAVDEFRATVRQSPGDAVLRAEWASVLEDAGRTDEAIREHINVIGTDVLRVDSLRALRRLYGRSTGDARIVADRLRMDVAASILTALSVADPEDQRLQREARSRWDDAARGQVSEVDFEGILRHPTERHPATGLLASLAEVVPRIHPINIEEWGVTRADRLPQRTDEPLRPLVARLSALFGIEDHFDVFMVRTGVSQVEIEATFPASLLVPITLMTTVPRRELVLQLARALGRLRAGSYLAARLSARELGIVLAGSLRSRYADYGRGLAPEETLNDVAQKVSKLIPRRHRRAFDRGVVGVAEAGPLDVNRWRQGMIHTAHRTAVVASGDVLGALDQIIRSERRLSAAAAVSSSELLEAARTLPEFTELVAFALSDDFANLRRQIS